MIPVEFLTERSSELLLRIREHLLLTGVATGVAVLFGVPVGIYITGRAWLRSVIFALAGIVQTVPSLAMLAFLLTLTGKIGVVPAIIALTLYAFLPIIQNTVTGLEGVAPEVVEAARGMGMTTWEEMYLVKLPLARPVIIAGIRTAAIISVGIATLSAFIGAGGLGEFINRGLSLVDTRLILLGAVPSAMLALYVSFAISSLEWGLNKRKRKASRLLGGRPGLVLSLLPLGVLFLVGGTGTAWESQPGHGRIIRVGSKNFTEQLILSEMIAQRIEAATDIEVERRLNLGGTMVCHGALLEGEIDIYPEYTGTALTAILKYEDRPGGPDEVYETVSGDYLEKFNLIWLRPFGFNNTYALAIKEEKGRLTGWKRISDMAPAASDIRAGFTAEFAERPDGYPGLSSAYGFEFGDVRDLDPALMYDALRNDEVDLIVAFSTDSRILGYDLMLLEDDRSFFPPYHAAPVIRKETLDEFPELSQALAPLGGLIDDRTMQLLNYEADQKKRDVKEVVREFLLQEGLLGPG